MIARTEGLALNLQIDVSRQLLRPFGRNADAVSRLLPQLREFHANPVEVPSGDFFDRLRALAVVAVGLHQNYPLRH